jgi:integrase/recombinase XerD
MMRDRFPAFLDYMRLAPSSKRVYTARMKKLCSEYPDLEYYQYKDIIRIFGKIQRRHFGTTYPHSILAALKHYFSFLIDEGFRENHPCQTMRLRSSVVKGVVLTDLFNMNELFSLFTRVKKHKDFDLRNKILISFLIYQAAVPEELTKVLWSDIDMENGLILLKGTRVVNRRSMKLTATQLDYMDQYNIECSLKSIQKSEVFIRKSGKMISQDDIHYLISSAQHFFPNKKLNTVKIRQSVIAFWLNEKSIPLEQVQLMSGYKWVSSLQQYYFPDFESDRAILKKLHPLG